MALFPPGDNNPIDIYPIKNPLDGTEMFEIQSEGTLKLYARSQELMTVPPGSKGTFTLTAGATSTTVTNVNCYATSVILPSPTTSDAANDMATTWFTPGTGSFVVHHANNSRVDRTFSYVIL